MTKLAFVSAAPTLRAKVWCTKNNGRAICDNRRKLNVSATIETTRPNVTKETQKRGSRYDETAAQEMLARACEQAKVSDEAAKKIEALCEELVQAGERANLTGTKTIADTLVLHGVDSLSLLPNLDIAEVGKQVVDIGSGAGFPGLPLAIARQDWNLTLVEATRKKIEFQSNAIQSFDIHNASPIWARAETLDMCHREMYDACVARAVAHMRSLAEITLPFVRVGGLLIAQKSLDESQSELRSAQNALCLLGAKIVDVRPAWTEHIIEEVAREFGHHDSMEHTKQRDDKRVKSLIVIRKIKETPFMYPRSHNSIKKKPL